MTNLKFKKTNPPVTRRQYSNMLHDCPFLYLAAPTLLTNPYSELLQLTLPTDADALQVTVFNAHNAAVAGVKVSVGYGSTLGTSSGTLGLAGSGLPIDGVLTKCTQNGNATGTLSAAPLASTGAIGANIGGASCGFGTFDLTYCPTVPRIEGNDRDKPVAYVSITWPAGAMRTFAELDGTTSRTWQDEGSQVGRIAPFGRPRRVMVAANNDAQDNPAFYLASNGAVRSHTQFPAVMITISCRNGIGQTLVVYADSVWAGTAATPQYCNVLAEMQAIGSTPSSPMTVCNFAVPSTDLPRWYARAQSTYTLLGYANVLVPCATPNSLASPITQSDINLIRRSFAQIRKLFDRPGIFLYTATCPPTNPAWKQYGNSDKLRIDNNNYYRKSSFVCLDSAEAVSGPMVTVPSGPQAGQQQVGLDPEYNADDIHLKSAGSRRIADSCYPKYAAS